jgi:hypothetical protein
MSDAVVGNCLHLYLQNYSLIGSLDEQESLPSELKDEELLLSSFSERASDQAASILEGLYSRVLAAAALPYRVQRRSQRRTVREQWRMDGPFFRPREKTARNFWSLYLGCLKDKGPVSCLVLSPNEPENLASMEILADETAVLLGIESANPRICFGHDSGYECGIIVGLATLNPSSGHDVVAATIKEHTEQFFSKHRDRLEKALSGS